MTAPGVSPYSLRVLRTIDGARIGFVEFTALQLIAATDDLGRLELATLLRRAPSTTSRIVQALVLRGLVAGYNEKYGPIHARRRLRVRATAAGAALAGEPRRKSDREVFG